MITLNQLREGIEAQIKEVEVVRDSFPSPMYRIAPNPSKIHADGYLAALNDILDEIKE